MVAVLQPLSEGKYIAIDRAVVLVGRGADCDAVITASKKISRRHCCLVQVDNTYYVRDLGSMNGVWLNGSRVNREAQIGQGDKVAIGDVEFLFHPNARIEQRQTIASAPPPAPPLENPVEALPIDNADLPIVEEVEVIDGEVNSEKLFEIVDDLLDMDDELLETNEVEIIDDPIIDENDDDYLDDIIVYED